MRPRWLLALALASCSKDPAPSDPQVTSFVVRREIPLGTQQKLDLLFVVDNSPAMAPHRATLAANAANWVNILATVQFGMPDLQLGILTTDLGTRGAEDNTSPTINNCTENGDGGILRPIAGTASKFFVDRQHLDGTHEVNYDGALGDALAATFDAIPTGCSFPRPLEAVRRAVQNPANTGFIRDNSFLLVVFLTPNDDCSFRHGAFLDGADAFSCVESTDLVPVEELAAALAAAKDNPVRIGVAGGFGPAAPFVADAGLRTVAPSCTIDQRSAQPGVRLQAFLDEFPVSSFTSLCNNNLGDVLQLLQETIIVDFGSPCFEQTIPESDPETPGDQFDCAAWLETEGTEIVLPPCGATDQLCWRIDEDPVSCPGGANQILRLDHFKLPVESSTLVIECVAQ